MKKIIALLLAVCTLFLLVACQNSKTDENQTTGGEEGTKAPIEENEDGLFKTIYDDLPATMNFGGEVINVAVRANERFYSEIDITEETATTNVLNRAIYSRNLAIEERLNVFIEITRVGDLSFHGPWEDLSVLVASGTDTYDVAMGSSYRVNQYIQKGDLVNLRNLENLDLTKEYWAQYMLDSLTIADATYAATGSISTYTYDSAFVIYFNKVLCESYGIKADSVYQTVLDGNWTMDEMMTLTKDIYLDKNGNGQVDDGDVYGFGMQVTSATDAFYSAFDIPVTIVGDNDLNFAVDTQKLSGVVDTLKSFVWDNDGVVALSENTGSATGEIYYFDQQFANDQLLFVTDWLYRSSQDVMRNMESDYGVLPYPKYDNNQKNYYTALHDAFTVVSVPRTVPAENRAMVGAFLEAMASGGQNTVMPAYYEKTLTARNIRDPESVKTLDIIVQNIYLDPMNLLNKGPLNKLLREQVWYKRTNFASEYRSLYTEANKQLEGVYSAYEKYTDN